jgi:hypothetical protein
MIDMYEEFEHAKEVVRIHKSKKDRQIITWWQTTISSNTFNTESSECLKYFLCFWIGIKSYKKTLLKVKKRCSTHLIQCCNFHNMNMHVQWFALYIFSDFMWEVIMNRKLRFCNNIQWIHCLSSCNYLSVLFIFMDSDHFFVIFKLFLHIKRKDLLDQA